jgi:hypothetical protein
MDRSSAHRIGPRTAREVNTRSLGKSPTEYACTPRTGHRVGALLGVVITTTRRKRRSSHTRRHQPATMRRTRSSFLELQIINDSCRRKIYLSSIFLRNGPIMIRYAPMSAIRPRSPAVSVRFCALFTDRCRLITKRFCVRFRLSGMTDRCWLITDRCQRRAEVASRGARVAGRHLSIWKADRPLVAPTRASC